MDDDDRYVCYVCGLCEWSVGPYVTWSHELMPNSEYEAPICSICERRDQINELAPELLMACQDAVVRLMCAEKPGDEALDVISDLREVIDQAYGKWCPPGTK